MAHGAAGLACAPSASGQVREEQGDLAGGRFPAHAERLRLFGSIARMNPKAPLPALRDQKPSWKAAALLARKWRLGKLAERLDALAGNQDL